MKNLSQIFKTFALCVLMLATLSVASATGGWNAPTALFPGGNISAPITGPLIDASSSQIIGTSTPQIKMGSLIVNGLQVNGTGYISTSTTYVASSSLTLAVNGALGASSYCDAAGANCVTAPELANITASVPQGGIISFNGSTCPTGWQNVPASGRYIVGLNPGGKLGAAVGIALSNGENRPTGQHMHSASTTPHSHTVPGYNFIGEETDMGDRNTMVPITSALNNTPISTNAVSANITVLPPEGSIAGTNAPYAQLLYCSKGAVNVITTGASFTLSSGQQSVTADNGTTTVALSQTLTTGDDITIKWSGVNMSNCVASNTYGRSILVGSTPTQWTGSKASAGSLTGTVQIRSAVVPATGVMKYVLSCTGIDNKAYTYTINTPKDTRAIDPGSSSFYIGASQSNQNATANQSKPTVSLPNPLIIGEAITFGWGPGVNMASCTATNTYGRSIDVNGAATTWTGTKETGGVLQGKVKIRTAVVPAAGVIKYVLTCTGLDSKSYVYTITTPNDSKAIGH